MAEQVEKSRIDYESERLDAYRKTGEIGSGLSLTATLAVAHAKHNWEGIRAEWAAFERGNIDVLMQIAAAVEDMYRKMKEFEFKHWMGFCDEDVKELLRLRHQWDNFDWKDRSAKAEREAKKLRALWDPSPVGADGKWDDDYWKAAWQKYIDRRARKPLQEFVDSPRSATTDHLKVMMMGTAGRVLITARDRFSQGDERSKYGGAWITMIFDESSGYPRGGIQGHCATRDEGVALIQALIDDIPKMKPDKNIGIG